MATVAVGLGDRRPTHWAALIRSACETLTRTSPALIAALTVSLPASEPAQINRLEKIARSLAAEYEFDAALTEENAHISVRLTRRQSHGGAL
ncbi:MAG: hypothetical protein MUP14_06865 [Dehalococcoidia bacterium]|nr:hypothetical protein [Dehalococcoidia bacterium]